MPDILCLGNGSYDIYFVVEGYPVENLKYAADVFLESPGNPFPGQHRGSSSAVSAISVRECPRSWG
jgi:hypothetical protein